MDATRALPHGISVLTPMLVCRDASAAMDFYTAVFDAVERNRRLGPDGTVAHGLLEIGGATLMVEGDWPGIPSQPPPSDGSSPVVLYLYVTDVDDVVSRAMAAGARLLMPVEDRFWGDRTGRIIDPAGHVWTISSRVEETSAEERRNRWDSIRSGGGSTSGEPTPKG